MLSSDGNLWLIISKYYPDTRRRSVFKMKGFRSTNLRLIPGGVSQLIAYALLSPAGPFPLMCTAFAFAGFGMALQNAQGNGFVGSLNNSGVMLSLLHASYGT